MKKRITKDVVTKALTMAIQRKRPQKGLIFHSDRESQYASHECRKLLGKHHFIQSMSGKGNCYDNAVTESFFHILKTELIYGENTKLGQKLVRASSNTSRYSTIESGVIHI